MTNSPALAEQAWMEFEKGGVEGAAKFLEDLPDPFATATAADELARRIYNEKRDASAAAVIWQAGIRRTMIEAELASKRDPNRAYALRSAAKTCTYNLAANTWPGWGDEGIVIGPDERSVGMRAARANLRMAGELDKGPLALSRAWWILGAHLLAGGQWNDARDAFKSASERAAEAGEESEQWLSIGFGRLTNVLEDPTSPERRAALDEVKTHLATLPNGEAFVSQIETAHRAFSKQ